MKIANLFSKLDNKWIINSLFSAAFLLLIMSLILSWQHFRRSYNTNNLVWHTYTVIGKADQLRFDIAEMESRVNLYVISNNSNGEIIQNLNVITADISQLMIALESLTNDNPVQRANLAKLRPLVNEKVTYMQKILQMGKVNKNQAQALAVDEGRILVSTSISQALTAVVDEELRLLSIRTQMYQKNTSSIIRQLSISSIAAGFIFLFCFILLNSYLRKRDEYLKAKKESQEALLDMNDKLLVSEKRYLLATEGSAIGLWDWNPATNEVYYSSYFKKMLGYDNGEFPDTLDSFNNILHKNDYARLWSEVEHHLQDKTPFKIEYRLRAKSGEYKWFQASGRAIWNNFGKPIRMVGSLIDVNDKKIAEHRLAMQYEIIRLLSSSHSFSDTFTKIIQAICKMMPFDMAAYWKINDDQSLKCVMCWPITRADFGDFTKITKQLSLPVGTGIQREIMRTLKPVYIDNVIDHPDFVRAEQAKMYGIKSACFIPIVHKNHLVGMLEFFITTNFVVDESMLGMLFYVACLMGEYIVQSQSAQKLQESELYKTAILDSAQESIITVDVHGRILSCNLQTNDMFHYGNDDLQEDNINALLPDFTKEFNQQDDKKVVEWIGRYKNGEYFNAEVIYSKMSLENQLSYVIIIRDISERKKIEKMKNEFVSLVSHELRTPLTSILGSLDLILDGTAGKVDEDAMELLDITRQNSERLVRLINDILDIEKIESGKMEFRLQTLDIHSIVDEAITLNQPYAIKTGTNIVFSGTPLNLYVNVDRDKLMQVLTNLISNAIKFTPAGEQVTVSIAALGDAVRVSVSDKGPGISEEFRKRIFQKFAQEDSTVSRAKGGTGLGLSISKAIIDNLHGDIAYTTGKNGTTFYFDLPGVIPVIDHSVSVYETTAANKSANILFVENDMDIAVLIQRTLNAEGNIYHVKSIQAARDLLQKQMFDVVILDLMLPDGAGSQLLPELRSKQIPVIIYSAYELPMQYKTMVDHVLIKSKTSNKKILSIVRHILSKKTVELS